ncbi:MAG: metallophosphoesterase [Polyangiaceae bacterium]
MAAPVSASWACVFRCTVGISALLANACSYPRSPLLGVDRPPLAAYPSATVLPASDRIVVLGDLQRTSFLEHTVLRRELNDREQILLLKDVQQQAFGGVVLLGDMAFDGSDEAWAHFDALMQPLRKPKQKSGQPTETDRLFFPVMGNHDYSRGSGAQISRRFPSFEAATHYAFDWGKVRIIVLDGNRDRLCDPNLRHGSRPGCEAEWQAQLTWLRAELANVDESSAERSAILFVHQSPYTQSPWVAGDQADARAFAGALLDSRRGLALISAHAHGFERYHFVRVADDPRPAKDFVVSAGAGGPRPGTRRAGAAKDDSTLPWPRPFNYLLLEQTASAVEMRVRGIDTRGPCVEELEPEHRTFRFR